MGQRRRYRRQLARERAMMQSPVSVSDVGAPVPPPASAGFEAMPPAVARGAPPWWSQRPVQTTLAAGAAVGAAVGAPILGPIGSAIGAVVGAAVNAVRRFGLPGVVS